MTSLTSRPTEDSMQHIHETCFVFVWVTEGFPLVCVFVDGQALYLQRNTGMHSGALDVMENIEVFFTLWFTVELLLRVWVYGYTLLTDPMNVFDALVVIATLVDVIFTRLLALNDGGLIP
eukprot:803127-Amphidinium_carterae.1